MLLTNGGLDLRNQALQFAALSTLPAALSHDEVKIIQDLKERFREARRAQTMPGPDINVPSSFCQLLLIPRPLRPMLHRSGSLN